MFEKKPKEEPRFVLDKGQALGYVGAAYVLRDTVTGVHYLAVAGPSNGITSVTPLLDEKGNVIIDKNI